MSSEPKSDKTDIAIIGMACRFPGADNYEVFWDNLERGVSSIKEVPPERWEKDLYYSADPKEPGKSISKWYGLINGVDLFDNRFFNISPGEARYMDPQQRLLLEEAWHCLEDSGVGLKELQEKRTDVYVGTADWDYLLHASSSDINVHTVLGNHSSMLANRLSYVLGLNGASLALDTACSSSLFAAEKARQALLSSRADYALLASACVHSHPLKYIAFSKAHIVSPDGQCKTFDRDANGFVLGDGVGVLLLQRLRDAVKGKKHIYGIIKGVATNHGGHGMTISSPRALAQVQVVEEAYRQAGVSPESVNYIEAHGTGTLIGDPIEVEALTTVFRRHTREKQFCTLGSVKTNIGHTGGSAGMAGIIKVLSMMRAQKIAPNLNFNAPNPVIDFKESPFRVATALTPWTPADKRTPLRAGVSAFGFGGANAHMVLEAPPCISEPEKAAQGPGLFMLSAKSGQSLSALLKRWKSFLGSDEFRRYSLGDILRTLATGRESFPFRFGCVATSHDELRRGLNAAPDVFSVRKTPFLCLRIGMVFWQGWADLEPLCKANRPFERELAKVAALLSKGKGKQACPGLRRKKWAANHELYRFMAGFSFLKSLLETGGIVPDLLSFDTKESCVFTALSLAGSLAVEDALEILAGSRSAAGVDLHRPDIAFFDPAAGKPVNSVHFDPDYLKNLREHLWISEDSAKQILAKTRALLENQFTFKNYVKEWDVVLKARGKSIRGIIGDDARFEKNQHLFCVIAASCIRRLNRKWDLSEKEVEASPEFSELVDLVTDNLMPQKTLLSLLTDEAPDFPAAADLLNKNQKNLSPATPCTILRKQKLAGFEDLSKWLKRIENRAGFDPGDRLCFDFGQLGGVKPGGDSVAVDMEDAPCAVVGKTLFDLWCRGVYVTFDRLYPDGSFQKVPLPVYPFNGESYWLPKKGEQDMIQSTLHPLVHRNTSDLSEQRFSATFAGNEFFFADHRVGSLRVLPGVAHLEMARCALELAAGDASKEQTSIVLKNVVWLRPVVSDTLPVAVNIGLFPLENEEIGYEIYGGTDACEVQVFSQGTALLEPVGDAPAADIEALKARCGRAVLTAAEHYGKLKDAGLNLGVTFQGIETLYVGDACALARLSLPPAARSTMPGFVLHPGLLDAALQAASCLFDASGAFELAIPFSLKRIEIFGRTASPMWSFAEKSKDHDHSFDVELFDGEGNLCARVQDIAFRKPRFGADTGTLVLTSVWRQEEASGSPSQYLRHRILICEGADTGKLKARLQGAAVDVLSSASKTIDGRFRDYAIQTFLAIQAEMTSAGNLSGKRLLQVVLPSASARTAPWLYGLSGLLKTASLENPGLVCQLIETDLSSAQPLLENMATPGDRVIRYEGDTRFVERVQEAEEGEPDFSWKDKCTCLITGGLGGLGKIFSLEIVRSAKDATLILTGRSPLDSASRSFIGQLQKTGARVEYLQADVGRKDEVESLVARIRKDHGPLTGIIHSAGIVADNFIVNKSVDECDRVMDPKVRGLVNLDGATCEDPLDFFIIFSSMAGSFGNLGQADYACANAFAGGWAAYRNGLVKENLRRGRTVSIHWPLWKEGGMTVGAETERMMRQSMGMVPMDTEAGIEGFYRSVALGQPAPMVVGGDVPAIRQKLVAATVAEQNDAPKPPAAGVSAPAADVSAPVDNDALYTHIRSVVTDEVSRMMGIPKETIDGSAALESYGFDSISLTELTNDLNAAYGLDLAPTLFFEYPSVDRLSEYFAAEHGSAFGAKITDSVSINEKEATAPVRVRPRFSSLRTASGHSDNRVAIVGISGRFPMADDIDAFWKNLAGGKHCITEIPEDRWDWKALSRGEGNTANLRWGGFINGVGEFDPSFFGISPREAELMDPQQRLMMLYAWKAIEDAGIPASHLAGSKTGIFVGTGGSQYAEIIARAGIPVEGYTSTGSVPSVGPNRMSFFLDVHGPSEPVETSCSSSLIALHRAVEAMANGDCDMAIVGGVNTIITPNFHLSFGNAGMLSPDGRCKAFSDQADGYVRGEAVGMLFLKRLGDAKRSCDHIYGVIRGTAVNHGGRASSLTAPNPKAQTDVLVQAYRRAGIDPATVGYIEAHGTGTRLGDPIEIEALKAAFKALNPEGDAHCAVGSVKSNIGHTELAAGVTSVIKVLLQIRHKTIAKSLHCHTVNPYIRLEGSPFTIARETREWVAPRDAAGNILPRRAGVSAFGFGGANAHVVIEEYLENEAQIPAMASPGQVPAGPYLFILSARNGERLQAYARVMAKFLSETPHADLSGIAYTLQTGRTAMAERLGLVAGSVKEAVEKFSCFADGRDDVSGLYCGRVGPNGDTMAAFGADDELKEAVDKWIERGKYGKLLSRWVQGMAFDFNSLYGETRPRRVSLPTYPFARDRYWIDGAVQNNDRIPGTGIPSAPPENVPLTGAAMFRPSWREKTPEALDGQPEFERRIIALCEPEPSLHKSLATAFEDAGVIRLTSWAKLMDRKFSECAVSLFEAVKSMVLKRSRGRALIQVVAFPGKDGAQDLFSGLSGLLKTVHLENPKVFGQMIEAGKGDDVAAVLKENAAHPEDVRIRYVKNRRLVEAFEEIRELPETPAMPWKDNGIYLISGGAGGLGLIFAEEIAARVKNPVLILTGRSTPGAKRQARLDALKASGARVEFRPADVTRKADVKKLIKGIVSDFGGLNGIIHAAGVIDDNFIINKSVNDFHAVLAPKVAGITLLDGASAGLDLDFFAAFSSGVGAVGNPGQADYACGNAYMDAFVLHRDRLVREGKRSGKSISVNWAPWKAGGMPVDRVTETVRDSGMVAMETETGIRAFSQALALDAPVVMPMEGDLPAMRRHMAGLRAEKNAAGPEDSAGPVVSQVAPERLYEKTFHGLKHLLAEITRVPTADIGPDDPFEDFGIDSFMITRLNGRLAELFQGVPKTLFYEYRTLAELTRYFVDEYKAGCLVLGGPDPVPVKTVAAGIGRSDYERYEIPARVAPAAPDGTPGNALSEGAIAVIGMSGRYPLAKDLGAYWENLAGGKDCIREIPEERWPMDGFFEPDPDIAMARGKSYCRWGGFIDGFADFDPLFFNISPREGMNMDPQERLFIQACWEVFEDAGYTRIRVKESCGGRVGVFAGITKTGYALHGPSLWQQGKTVHPDTSFSSLSNRVSFLLDLKGPSLPIDTMCSSSLTAIHEACEHLHRNECDMAVAGGVNLYLHPSSYVRLCSMRMLAGDNKNKSFGQGGDGFLPGEGVGAVLLKPLEKAIQDGDPIYALIRGTGINHGGRTGGYTIPSPVAQAELIRSVMEKARVTPGEISYVEAHGTGTELGDPIEIAGLSRAFGNATTPSCAIGSAKSNIGHTEAAAGIAGLSKIILQMQHGQIAPSLHAKTLNPNIDFDKTPFAVQQTLGDWKRPEINGRQVPRMAGLSSFGAGGANAHIIVEEFLGRESYGQSRGEGMDGPVLFVLSARNEDRLRAYAARMDAWLGRHPDSRPADVAYTTQTGREAMKARIALIAVSLNEIKEKLARYVAGEEEIEGFYRGTVAENRDTAALFLTDEDLQDAVRAWVAKAKFDKVLGLWVKGLGLDWNLLYEGRITPRRISLPTYPFAEDRYWPVGDDGQKGTPDSVMTFEEYLEESPSGTRSSEFLRTLVCVLATSAHEHAVSRVLKELAPDTHVEFWALDGGGGRSLADAFAAAGKAQGGIDAVLYMAALEDPGMIDDFSGIVSCIKAMPKGYDTRVLLAAEPTDGPERCYPESWVGFERSLGLVMPRIQLGVIMAEAPSNPQEPSARLTDWTQRLWRELLAPKVESAVYRKNKRFVYRIRPTEQGSVPGLIKPDHTYLITGGCGGLGVLFARHLLENYSVNLILAGRSRLDQTRRATLSRLEKLNPSAKVAYLEADVSDAPAMARGIAALKKTLGPISGVIHAAGVQEPLSITEKQIQSFNQTLSPKVKGAHVLDEVLRDEPLDFICYFSSSAAILGDFGWCDYAVANRYLSAFAGYKKRKGDSVVPLVIHWPLWQEGGMGFDSRESADTYLQASGQRLLLTEEGLSLFDRLLSKGGGQHLVLSGNPSRINGFLGRGPSGPDKSPGIPPVPVGAAPGKGRRPGMEDLSLNACIAWDLKEQIGRILAIPFDQLDPDVNLTEFGFDSVTLTEFAARVSNVYGIEITPALFFEYNTVDRLAAYLGENHAPAVQGFYGGTAVPACGVETGTLCPRPGDMDAWLRQHPECVPLNGGSLNGSHLNGGGHRKFCFWIHPLTGSVEAYLKIAKGMDKGLHVFGIRSRGFGTDRGFLPTIPEMARYYIDVIEGIDLGGPYHLAGFSMGGVIAYEMAKQLQEKGKRVGSLLLLEPPFPQGAELAETADEIALAPSTIVTTADFFLYSHLKTILPSKGDGAQWGDGKLTGEALIERLASELRDRGVRQPAGEIASTIKNMCYAFAHNKRALAGYSVSPLPFPEQADIYYFIQSEETTGHPAPEHARHALHRGTEKLLGRDLTHDGAHYLKWKGILPGLATVGVPKSSHFDFLSDRTGLSAIIENCRSIYRRAINPGGRTLSLQTPRAGQTVRQVSHSTNTLQSRGVAVVGMSGRFPKARDLSEFWQRLAAGTDCITEIPEDRWDWKAIYGDPLKPGNRTKAKWGGFMDGVGDFDPMFFGIAPKEAGWMDPQQRLLMLYVWTAMEDAGYAAESLAGSRTSLFIGTGDSGYGNLICAGGQDLEGYFGTSVLPAMGPNRMSYFLDLHGTSEPVDTTCSSSLVAICRAVAAIEGGACEAAIAGGVNLIVDPSFHVSLDRLGMLSGTGRCRTFSDRADGYVRGEGVGMLFLKSLDAAEQDGDHIYGVIRGSAVNHGGRANSLTAPNPRAQVEVIRAAYEKACIDPATVGYIEAHGTGTALGDPIEVDALKTAFTSLGQGAEASDSPASPHCGLGSVKTNIGHLELAAGVAGVIKVLLQLEHKTIVKSLHCDTVNPHIKLADSPFYIANASRAWEPPRGGGARRAGVSAFGAGGVNAHVVIEEYTGKTDTTQASAAGRPAIFLLSAKNEERLKTYALRMGEFLDTGLKAGSAPDLADVAFTSQVGRSALEERLALIVSSVEELRDTLKEFATGGPTGSAVNGAFRGNVKRDKETLALLTSDEDFSVLIDKWVARGNFTKLLSLWVKGLSFNWRRIYGAQTPRRISLPTYPFTDTRYWIPGATRAGGTGVRKGALHPLLHENTSDLTEQRFSSVFTGEEFFLADHKVHGQKILPVSVYLEMARAAAVRSAGPSGETSHGSTPSVVLKDVTGGPLQAPEGEQIHIGLFPEAHDELGFEIYTRPGGEEPLVACRGTVALNAEDPAGTHDITALMEKCPAGPVDTGTVGRGDGPGLRAIEQVYAGTDMVLARVRLPESVSRTADAYVLHPALMESALQACALLTEDGSFGGGTFSMDRLLVTGECLPAMWAVIRLEDDGFHVDLCDDTGGVRVRMQGARFDYRGVDSGTRDSGIRKSEVPSLPEASTPLMTFEEYLEEGEVRPDSEMHIGKLLCIAEDAEAICAALKARSPETETLFIRLLAASDTNSLQTAVAELLRGHDGVDAVLVAPSPDGVAAGRAEEDIMHILRAVAGVKMPGTVRFLVAANYPDGIASCHADAWVGFERSLPLVMPRVQFGVIYSGDEMAPSRWIEILWQELCARKIESAVYHGKTRYVHRNRETTAEPDPTVDSLITRGKTYLITGGCGGLGGMLARYMTERYGVNLILTGRSPLSERIRGVLAEIGPNACYVQADICDAEAMKKGIARAKKTLGDVSGVIHAAGIESRGDILDKDTEDFNRVLRPKIRGTLALEEALNEKPLEFICYFSSASAILGDFGACDYAVANRFMAAFAGFRNRAQTGVRHLAVHWPLWREGGMGFDHDGEAEVYLKSSGQRLLEREEGLKLFDRLLSRGGTGHLVLAGEHERIKGFLGLGKKAAPAPDLPAAEPVPCGRREEMKGLSVAQCLEYDLITHIGTLLGVDPSQLDADTNLADFGFDSILFAKFADVLTRMYKTEITPSIFFGNPTVERLVHYFLQTHGGVMASFYGKAEDGPESPGQSTPAPAALKVAPRPLPVPAASGRRKPRFISPGPARPEAIAIIGMSGRFPGARNVDELWDILRDGKEAVSQIPAGRFDVQRYCGRTGGEAAIVSDRCGILPGVDEFDPSFFEISPKEAAGMDPRQRLLLQESWKALEDAGYGPARINENRMGVFVGMETGDYRALAGREKGITSDHEGICAARLAYFLNFKGPAMAINTACSSGLVAAHQACQSLSTGECDTAVAAGVNLMLTPEAFIGVSQSGMLSPSGKCYAFDKRADGMVPGEAVVSVVLKRLGDAQRDHDPVYAVIRGSGINYDGKTNGITAPNQEAQAELLRSVYDRYSINPADISHIVTHGTGTKLGDSIEINALVDAFTGYTQTPRFCALTSTKTNFGHCFAASGLLSLVSLVQGLRHATIPESLNFSEENDHIRWDESPFYVNDAARPWKGKTRLGAVSAFGMSGTNAHMVVESYTQNAGSGAIEPGYLLVFSAKQEERLEEKIRDMAAFFRNNELTPADLGEVCLTLSRGRHHFMHRSAVVVQDPSDARRVLNQLIARERSPKIFRGKVPRGFTGQPAIRDLATDMLNRARGKRGEKEAYREILYGLAELYCQGYGISLDRLIAPGTGTGLRLPTYPFARKRYWVAEATAEPLPAQAFTEKLETRPAVTSEPDPAPSANAARIELPPLNCDAQPKAPPAPGGSLQSRLKKSLAKALYMDEKDMDPDLAFTQMGMDSIIGVEWIKAVNEEFGTTIEAIKIYDYPSLREFGKFLAEQFGEGTSAAPIPGGPAETLGTPATPVTAISLAPLEGLGILSDTQEKTQPKITLDTLPPETSPVPATGPQIIQGSLEDALKKSLARALYMDGSDIDPGQPFTEMGMDSIIGVEWIKAVNEEFCTAIEAIRIYDYPNLAEFGEFLAGKLRGKSSGAPDANPAAAAKMPGAPVTPGAKVALAPLQEIGSLEHGPGKGQPKITLDLLSETEPYTAPVAEPDIPAPAAAPRAPAVPGPLSEALKKSLAQGLYMDEGNIDPDMPFTEMGMDSIIGVEWIKAVNEAFGTAIEAIKIYDHPSLREFEAFLKDKLDSDLVSGKAIEPGPEGADRPVTPPAPVSLEDILEQVQQGVLDIDQADRLLETLKGE